jgi:hypothetical protein
MDPRTQAPIELYFKELKTPDEAAKGKSLSPYYGLVAKHIDKDPDHEIFPDNAVLVADSKKGRLFLRTADDMWVLARCTELGVDPDYGVLAQFRIDQKTVEDYLKANIA